MKKYLIYILLFIPLFFFSLIVLGVFFDITIIPDGFLRDDSFEYNGDGLKPNGLISQTLFEFISFVAIIPGSFAGLIYIIHKKLWWWFTLYIVVIVIPVVIFILLLLVN